MSGKSLRGRGLRGRGVEVVWNEPCGNGTDTRRFRQFSTFFDVNHPPCNRLPMSHNVAYKALYCVHLVS